MAVIGMGCLFPQAENLARYWANIRDGKDSISDVPPSHWRPEDYFDPDPKAPDRTYARRGGFLEPVDFPLMEFGIAPHAIEATDTTQLLGLLAAQRALQDAGYAAERAFDRERVSVILGVTGALEMVVPLGARLGRPIWRRALDAAGVDPKVALEVVERIAASYTPWQENSFPGLLGNVAAGRIANRLDLKGSNCVVDAACASSLAAVNLAMLELAAGRCDMALSGGVDTFNDIFMYMCFSKTPALSPTGEARPFDAQADGTILGEGVGILVLKRLADAIRDGDRVRGVIRSMGTSSDGKGQAVYAPSAAGQARALERAYELAGVSPATVELVEAHGTGTRVGDAVELAALEQVYGGAARGGGWCALGSVKSQVGHTKAAAGAAGLIKAILALEHRVLPPSIKVQRPIDSLAEGRSPFYLNHEPRPWLESPGHPRRAAVSAFGFGGSNFHCVLEEAGPRPAAVDWDGDVQIAALSADRVDDLARALEPYERVAGWEDFRALASQGRADFSPRHEHRLLWVAVRDRDQPAELAALARRRIAELGRPRDRARPGAERILSGAGGPPGLLAMLFPGQGSQYVGMGRELACRFPAMHDALALLNRFEGGGEISLADAIYPTRVHDDESRRGCEAILRDTRLAQPALGAISLGMARILEGFGVRPDLAAGHSFGELTALLAAWRIDEAAFARLSWVRGSLMGRCAADGEGAMLVVFAAPERTGRLVRELGLDLVVANKNAPEQCVVSGTKGEIERARAALESRGVATRLAHVSAAFHSPLVASAQAPFRHAMSAVSFAPGKLPVYANTTAAPYPEPADLARDLLAGQLASPVEFVAQIEAMHAAGARVFLEVGPDSKLTGLVRSILEKRENVVLAVDASKGKLGGLHDLACALASLAALGYDVALRRFDDAPTAPAAPPRKPGLVVKVCGANKKPAEAAAKPAEAASRPAPGGVQTVTSRPREVERTSPWTPPVETRNQDENDRIMNSSPEYYPSHANGTHDNGESLPRDPRGNGVARQPGGRRLDPRPPRSEERGGLLEQSRQNLAALERMAERTAELHRLFLEGQEKTQAALLKLLEDQERIAFGVVPSADEPMLKEGRGRPEPAVASPDDEPRRVARPAFDQARHQNGERPEPARPATAPAAVRPAPTAAAIPPRHEALERLLIEVVADKTGYPPQALDLDQALDGDLGIDSIKRVEILSALQERAPELPAFAPEQLGSITTLRGILECALGAGAEPAAAAATASAADQTDQDAIVRAIKGAIADKTGYPAEMLELEMALDADLGIDSIKRVEIFSALEERLPGAIRPDAETIAGLGTIRAIVEFLGRSPAPAATRAAGASGAKAPAGDLERVVLDTVAEKTGYPVEMLELDMALDADLGIDSIKRVEILAAVQDRSPGLRMIESEELAGLSTLREIIAALGEKPAAACPVEPARQPAGASDAGSPARPAHDSRAPLGVYVPRLVRLDERRGGERPIVVDGVVWVVDDGSGLAPALAAAIRERGGRPVLVSLDQAQGGDPPPAGLVIMAPSRGAGEGFLEQAFGLLRAAGPGLNQAAERGGGVLATVSRLGGGFGFGGLSADADPASGALAGLAKTAALEWPKVACKAIDVEPALDAGEAARHIADELFASGPVEVGLGRTGRFGVELDPFVTAGVGSFAPIERGQVVLASGGARGVTAAAAVALAEQFGPRLVLLGRAALKPAEDPATVHCATEAELRRVLLERGRLSPRELAARARAILAEREIRRTLARIEALGAQAVYHAVDVRDPDAVAGLVERVRRAHGEPRGLIHGAGVIADRRIVDLTLEQFRDVHQTKVAGLRNLLAAVDPRALNFVVLFSSSTARFGRVGQAAYAAANEALNKEAQSIAGRQPRTRVVSFNWGPWAGGMVDAGLRQVFEREGLDLIPLDQGARLVADVLRTPPGGPVELVVMAGSLPEPPPEVIPPLTRAIETAATEIVGRRQVSVDAVPVLRSHVIDGHAVLPMALVLEWLAEGAVQRHPGLPLHGVDELKLFKGVVLTDARGVELETHLAPAERSAGRLIVPVELRGRAIKGREYVHARARVLLGELCGSVPPRLALDPLSEVPLDPDDVYRDVLFHGPELRGLERIEALSAAGVQGWAAVAPAPARWLERPLRSGWLTDPLALDCAFQLMTIWCRQRLGHNSLPTAVGSYRQLVARFPAEGVRVTALVTWSSDSRAVADVEFTTAGGELVARIEAYECVVDASLKRAFRRNQLLVQGHGSAASTLSRVD